MSLGDQMTRDTKSIIAGVACLAVTIASTSAVIASKKVFANKEITHAEYLVPVEAAILEPVKYYLVTKTHTGIVVPTKASELGFERSGRLTEIHVERGDYIKSGIPIGKLDTSSLEIKRLELQAEKAQAEAIFSELKTGARTETIEMARAEIVNLSEQLELEQIKQQRREQLYQQGAITKEQLDEVVFKANALEARLSSARSELERLLAGTRKEKFVAQQAVITALEAKIKDVDNSIAKSTLRSPFAGIIANRFLDEGVVVDPGQPVVRLVKNEQYEVEIGLPVETALQLVSSSRQTIQIGNELYQASVKIVLPELDSTTKTRTVIFNLDSNSVSKVASGQTAKLLLTQSISANGYWLPTTALVGGERGVWYCYTLIAETEMRELGSRSQNLEPYRVSQKSIKIIRTEGDRVLVQGVFQPEETVVISGVEKIIPGQLVSRSSVQ